MSTEIADSNRVSVAFIKYYYNLLNSNEDKLFQLYSKEAVLRHNLHSEPFSSNTKNVVGNDNIKEHWKSSELAGAKVMIQSIDSTPSYNNSILIIAAGELALKSDDEFNDDQPSYKFVQTFVLVPTKGVFDVYNDVLTFIPDVDADYDVEEPVEETRDISEEKDNVEESLPVNDVQTGEVIEDKEHEEDGNTVIDPVPVSSNVSTTTIESVTETTPIPSTEDKEKEEVFSPKSTKESTPETAAEEEEQQEEDLEKKSSEEPVEEVAFEEDREATEDVETVSTKSDTPTTSEEIKKSPSVSSQAASSAPTKPLTWASLAAVGGAKNTSVAKVPTGLPQVVVSNGHKAAKSANGSSPNNTQGEFKKVTSKKNKRDYKKDVEEDEFIEGRNDVKAKTKFTNHAGQEVYPVYIKNVDASIKDTDLIAVLEQKFGKVDSCKIDRLVALVDFAKREAQAESIKLHKVRVKDFEIRIEHRIKKEDKSNFTKIKNKKKNNKHHTGNSFAGDNDGFKKVERK